MISILFEDDDLLAVDKPEGLAAIPERLGRNKSLFEMLSAERAEKLYIVHRLDKETSGHRAPAGQGDQRRDRLCQERRDPPPA